MNKLHIFMGVIGSGKDYRAQKEEVEHINLADALYYEVGIIMGVDLTSRAQREIWKAENPMHRKILQNYGVLRRVQNPNYWVDQWYTKVFCAITSKDVVCSDVRFPNELKAALDFMQETHFRMENGEFIDDCCLCDVEFTFCDFHSHRYDAYNNHESEQLAQRILKDGKKDGEILSHDYIRRLANGT